MAVSRAGHDTGELYVVMKQDTQYYWLCNGAQRGLESPKKKKAIHVQVIKKIPESVRMQIQQIQTDADIRKVLKAYGNILRAQEALKISEVQSRKAD